MKENNLESFLLFPLVLLISFALILYHYWQSNLTKIYQDALIKRDMNILEEALTARDKRIAELEEELDRLSKLVHKDNKLIPAMEYAIRSYMTSNTIVGNDVITTGEGLLKELTKLSYERKGILKQQTKQCQKLVPIGVECIDNLLNYMQQKMNNDNIELQPQLQNKNPI